MMTLLEDLGLALRQVCRAIGLSGNAATVVPLVVLGVALNVAALTAIEYVRNERHPGREHSVLRSAAQTELKVVRTVVVSTLKKINDGKRRWCLARQWVMDRRTDLTGYHIELGFVVAAPSNSGGCDIEVVGSHHRKTAIAFVQC
jgi:hypothetical protein